MEYTQEQKLHAQVVAKAWEDAQFKKDLVANPVETIEKFTGNKINLPEGHKLVVKDQTDEDVVYFNIPRKLNLDTLELTDEQLEMVAGGEIAVSASLACIGLFASGLAIGLAVSAMSK